MSRHPRAAALQTAREARRAAPLPDLGDAPLRAEAARCWAATTGMPAWSWLGALEPHTAPLAAAARAALAAGAQVHREGRWAVLACADGRRLVVDAAVLQQAMEMNPA